MKMFLSPFRSHQPKTWVELPKSKYGIEYVLGEKTTNNWRFPHRKSVPKLLNKGSKASKPSPFEVMLRCLNDVTIRDGYSAGTALMYIREIIEPGDSEYDYIDDYVCASTLTQEQVDRMRIIVLPWRREARLVSYINQFSPSSNQSTLHSVKNDRSTVLADFEYFHKRYLRIHDPKEKFDELFGFSFAIKHQSEWIFEYESQRKREKMIGNLAKHWRNLMMRHSPEQLGLDREFSLPALMDFLNKFKQLCDSIETFGNPPIFFQYSACRKIKMVTFNLDDDDADTLSSLTHTSSISPSS